MLKSNALFFKINCKAWLVLFLTDYLRMLLKETGPMHTLRQGGLVAF